jgi:hypothetical protein
MADARETCRERHSMDAHFDRVRLEVTLDSSIRHRICSLTMAWSKDLGNFYAISMSGLHLSNVVGIQAASSKPSHSKHQSSQLSWLVD